MEHLSAFQITDAELDLSRRVIEGELNLEDAVDQLREMFQRMQSSCRPPGGTARRLAPVNKCFHCSCCHAHTLYEHARLVESSGVLCQ